MKDKALKNITTAAFFILALIFAAKFAGPATLKLYIHSGFGGCQKIPTLCLSPEKEIINPEIDKNYILELISFKIEEVEVKMPKGFSVVKERIKKVYYKKNKHLDKGEAAYILYEMPDFFINLFPQLKRQNVTNDYEFFGRIMQARIKEIKNLTDAFFAIMKSVFIPDLGPQSGINMVKFSLDGKKGFINYGLGKKENYFDCNIFDNRGDFFKIYIKDRAGRLDLNKVMAIISTVKRAE